MLNTIWMPFSLFVRFKLQGNLVDLPLKFLCEEKLLPQMKSKEGFVPAMVFT